VAGWKPREPALADEQYTYPHPERQELAERIAALSAAADQPEALERAKARYDALDGQFPVWEENWLSIQAFLKVRTQWLRSGMGDATGLDFTAVERKVQRFVRIHQLDQAQEDRIFEDLDIMESVIVAEWAKQSKARSDDLARKGRMR
jgi:hypothetical protein